MAGVTKHIYDRDIIEIQRMWSKHLKSIADIMPYEYSYTDVIDLLKKYYPYEWKSVEYKKLYYDKKDYYIKRHKGKIRYNMPYAETLIKRNPTYKKLISKEFCEQYNKNFSAEKQREVAESLWRKRKIKIEKVDLKIKNAKEKTQSVTPAFINQMMGLYARKTTSQHDKVYILHELIKYYNPKVIQFLFKLNDTELNIQLRKLAFARLQSLNFQPRLRGQKDMQAPTSNKKRKQYLLKQYPYEKFSLEYTPTELEYRICNGGEQQIKTYDYFISHSSVDSTIVQQLIDNLNASNKNVFCDWISDSDYLKRNLLCEATLKVIEWRLEQSDAVIFVNTKNSYKSIWCKYELNYFYELGKPIYYLTDKDLQDGCYKLKKYDIDAVYDPKYKMINLGVK